MEGIKACAAACALACHLLHYHFRVGINMQNSCFEGEGTLKSFKQSHVLGHVVILVTNPFGNSKLPALGALNHHSNTRWPRVPQGAAIHIGYES